MARRKGGSRRGHVGVLVVARSCLHRAGQLLPPAAAAALACGAAVRRVGWRREWSPGRAVCSGHGLRSRLRRCSAAAATRQLVGGGRHGWGRGRWRRSSGWTAARLRGIGCAELTQSHDASVTDCARVVRFSGLPSPGAWWVGGGLPFAATHRSGLARRLGHVARYSAHIGIGERGALASGLARRPAWPAWFSRPARASRVLAATVPACSVAGGTQTAQPGWVRQLSPVRQLGHS